MSGGGDELLRGADLSRGPDLLRPGSRTCRGPVAPLFAFVYARYAGPGGDRLILRPATLGHEHILPEPGVLPALFGPGHRAVTAPARYARTLYGDRDPATGTFPAVGSVEDASDPTVRPRDGTLHHAGWFRVREDRQPTLARPLRIRQQQPDAIHRSGRAL